MDEKFVSFFYNPFNNILAHQVDAVTYFAVDLKKINYITPKILAHEELCVNNQNLDFYSFSIYYVFNFVCKVTAGILQLGATTSVNSQRSII